MRDESKRPEGKGLGGWGTEGEIGTVVGLRFSTKIRDGGSCCQSGLFSLGYIYPVAHFTLNVDCII